MPPKIPTLGHDAAVTLALQAVAVIAADEIRHEQCEQSAVETNRKQRQSISACVPAIAAYCDCKVWREKDGDGRIRYVFFGLRPSLEIAHYVYDVISTAMQTAWLQYSRNLRRGRAS